MMNIF